MSAIRKIVVSVATAFLGLSAMFMATAPAAAEPVAYAVECGDDWHTPCP